MSAIMSSSPRGGIRRHLERLASFGTFTGPCRNTRCESAGSALVDTSWLELRSVLTRSQPSERSLSLRIDSHFQASIPFARSINPISRSNWEGKGVEPDVVVREDVAGHAAHRAAIEGVLTQPLTTPHREAVQRQIDALTAILQSKQ
jgi:hypothetical protein